MTKLVPAVMALGLLAVATPSSAGCRWFGTQAGVCPRRESGADRHANRGRARIPQAVPPRGTHGGGALLPDRVAPDRRFQIELQNVGPDPTASAGEIGGEAYGW